MPMINHHQTKIFFTLHNQILSWQASGKFVQKPILCTEFLFVAKIRDMISTLCYVNFQILRPTVFKLGKFSCLLMKLHIEITQMPTEKNAAMV